MEWRSADARPALLPAHQTHDRAALDDHHVRAGLAHSRGPVHVAPGIVGAALVDAVAHRSEVRQHPRAGRIALLAVMRRSPADGSAISVAAGADAHHHGTVGVAPLAG